MEDEVTRIEAVRYLQGASGHAVLSTLFLLVAVALLWVDRWGIGVLVVLIAFGVALNGLSIYAWDRLRERFESADGSEDPDRTLTPHRVSPEMKAEMLAGGAIVGTLAAGIAVATVVPRLVGFRTAVSIAIVGLGVGNLVALGLASRRPARE